MVLWREASVYFGLKSHSGRERHRILAGQRAEQKKPLPRACFFCSACSEASDEPNCMAREKKHAEQKTRRTKTHAEPTHNLTEDGFRLDGDRSLHGPKDGCERGGPKLVLGLKCFWSGWLSRSKQSSMISGATCYLYVCHSLERWIRIRACFVLNVLTPGPATKQPSNNL